MDAKRYVWFKTCIAISLVMLTFTQFTKVLMNNKALIRSSIPAAITACMLIFIHIKVPHPMLLLERFFPGLGWLEIAVISLYAGFLFYKMHDIHQTSRWRTLSWSVFACFFFIQLLLGLTVSDAFLMNGKLHLPVPALIITGSLYRMQVSFMPILFVSAVLLSGPAWCSHLCYFGAFDNLAARAGTQKLKAVLFKNSMKHSFFFLIISVTIILRVFNVQAIYALIGASAIGVIGIMIIVFISTRYHSMIHCIAYCPIGTVIMYLKYISPFRMKINDQCTDCMLCRVSCRYDALNKKDIENRRPAHSCTFCGDCMSACKHNAIGYRFFTASPETSRTIYLAITVALHAVFLAVARI